MCECGGEVGCGGVCVVRGGGEDGVVGVCV